LFRRIVDWPDPGPAAAVHPARRPESPYVFTATPDVRYSTRSHGADGIPGGGLTRTTPAVVSTGDKLWLFLVGLDMRVWYRSIDADNAFSAWRTLHSWTRQPVAAVFHPERHEIMVFLRGDDQQVYYEALDETGRPRRSGAVPGVTSSLAPGAAVMNGRVHLFTVNAGGTAMATDFAIGADGAFRDPITPRAIGGASVRTGVSAAFDETGRRGILLAVLGDDFRVRTTVLEAGTTSPAWRQEGPNLAGGVAVTGNGLLFTKGFGDGRVYWKPFGTGTYASWPGM
jgi:hypothetical protein